MNPFTKGILSFLVFAAIWLAVGHMGFGTTNQFVILVIIIPLIFSLISGLISHFIKSKTKFSHFIGAAITAPFFVAVLNLIFHSFGEGGILMGI